MITHSPIKVLTITNHQLDQAGINETLARGQETQGPFVVKQLDLHFSDTSVARTITLSKVLTSDGSRKKIIKEWTADTNGSILKTWNLGDAVIVDEDETLKLEITKITGPITLVNGYVYIQTPKVI